MSARRSFFLTNGVRRDERGVPMLNNYHRIGRGPLRLVIHLAPLVLVPVMIALVVGFQMLTWHFEVAEGLGLALVCTLMALLIKIDLRARRALEALPTAQELAEAAGISEEELQQRAAGLGIKPVYRVNTADLYDPADLEGAGLLLRPAAAPSTEELLRPAAATGTSTDMLLRATSGSSAGEDRKLHHLSGQ